MTKQYDLTKKSTTQDRNKKFCIRKTSMKLNGTFKIQICDHSKSLKMPLF